VFVLLCWLSQVAGWKQKLADSFYGKFLILRDYRPLFICFEKGPLSRKTERKEEMKDGNVQLETRARGSNQMPESFKCTLMSLLCVITNIPA
jgi:hypothetical protein